jgi:nucleoid DNA-binding protein
VNKKDLARRLAKESHRSRAQAADVVDSLVHKLLMDLKRPAQKPKIHLEKTGLRAPAKEPS